jgi:hypothetical protein
VIDGRFNGLAILIRNERDSRQSVVDDTAQELLRLRDSRRVRTDRIAARIEEARNVRQRTDDNGA